MITMIVAKKSKTLKKKKISLPNRYNERRENKASNTKNKAVTIVEPGSIHSKKRKRIIIKTERQIFSKSQTKRITSNTDH